MKKLVLILVLTFALSGVFVSNVFAADKLNPTPENPVILRFSDALNPGHQSAVGAKEWCQYIEENSGGRIKTQFFDTGSLYAENKVLEAVMMGMCEGCQMLSSNLCATFPEWEMTTLPGMMDSIELYSKVADGEIGAKLMEGLERGGLKGLVFVPIAAPKPLYGTGYVTKTHFIKVPADFRGLKLRVVYPGDAAIINKYGGVPVSIPGGETFMALQLGTIDGTSTGFQQFKERKFHETGAIYYTVCPLKGGQVYITLLNKNFFDKLPSDLQILLLESGKAIIDVGRRQALMVEAATDNYQYAIDNGVLVYQLTPEDLAAWEEDIKQVVETAKAKSPVLKEIIEMAEETLTD